MHSAPNPHCSGSRLRKLSNQSKECLPSSGFSDSISRFLVEQYGRSTSVYPKPVLLQIFLFPILSLYHLSISCFLFRDLCSNKQNTDIKYFGFRGYEHRVVSLKYRISAQDSIRLLVISDDFFSFLTVMGCPQ